MLLLISALSFLTMFLMVYVVLTTYAPMAGVAHPAEGARQTDGAAVRC